MTTTLYAPAPYTAFESNGYRITQAGTAVPDGLVQAIVAAVYQADGVLLTSSAGGTALVQVGSYYNPGTGAPTSDNLPAGSEIKDSTGAVFEKKGDGTWVAAAANSLLTYAPLASPALTGTPTVNGATVEDRTHAAATYAQSAGTSFVGGSGFDLTGSADSSTAFQAMVTAASAAAAPGSYVSVVIPAQARLKVGGIVPKSNVAIRSAGGALISNGDAQGIITNRTAQVAVDNFRVEGVEFIGEGQNVGTSSERRGAIMIYTGSNIRIRDCYAHDFSFHGFHIQNARHIWIQDNRLENVCLSAFGNAIHIGLALSNFVSSPQATTGVVITGNVVRNCYTAPVCVQVTAHQSELTGATPDYAVVIADNPYLEHVSTLASGFAAIALEIARYGSAGDTSQGNKMGKVLVHDNVCKVIGTVPSGAPANGIACTDNNGSNGPQSSDWDEFFDIAIHHNVVDSIDGGITCQASRATVDHNIVTAARGGIAVAYNNNASHTPERINVDSNVITLDGASAVRAGILVSHTDKTTVRANRIYYVPTAADGQANVSNGIYGSAATNIEVIDNTVNGSTRHGVHLLTCTNYVVDRNRIYDPSSALTNGYHGIYLDGTTGHGTYKGSVQNNQIADTRGTPMMSNVIAHNGGTPRTYIVGNRGFGIAGGVAIGTPTVCYWIARNDFAGAHPFAASSITVGASPFSYQATVQSSIPCPQDVFVIGGTVSKIEKKRGSASAVDTGLTAGIFHLDMQETLIVTYTVAPTMKTFPAF